VSFLFNNDYNYFTIFFSIYLIKFIAYDIINSTKYLGELVWQAEKKQLDFDPYT